MLHISDQYPQSRILKFAEQLPFDDSIRVLTHFALPSADTEGFISAVHTLADNGPAQQQAIKFMAPQDFAKLTDEDVRVCVAWASPALQVKFKLPLCGIVNTFFTSAKRAPDAVAAIGPFARLLISTLKRMPTEELESSYAVPTIGAPYAAQFVEASVKTGPSKQFPLRSAVNFWGVPTWTSTKSLGELLRAAEAPEEAALVFTCSRLPGINLSCFNVSSISSLAKPGNSMTMEEVLVTVPPALFSVESSMFFGGNSKKIVVQLRVEASRAIFDYIGEVPKPAVVEEATTSDQNKPVTAGGARTIQLVPKFVASPTNKKAVTTLNATGNNGNNGNSQQQLPTEAKVPEWMDTHLETVPDDVKAVLLREEVTDLNVFLTLSESDLEKLGFSLGQRRKIAMTIAEVRGVIQMQKEEEERARREEAARLAAEANRPETPPPPLDGVLPEDNGSDDDHRAPVLNEWLQQQADEIRQRQGAPPSTRPSRSQSEFSIAPQQRPGGSSNPTVVQPGVNNPGAAPVPTWQQQAQQQYQYQQQQQQQQLQVAPWQLNVPPDQIARAQQFPPTAPPPPQQQQHQFVQQQPIQQQPAPQQQQVRLPPVGPSWLQHQPAAPPQIVVNDWQQPQNQQQPQQNAPMPAWMQPIQQPPQAPVVQQPPPQQPQQQHQNWQQPSQAAPQQQQQQQQHQQSWQQPQQQNFAPPAWQQQQQPAPPTPPQQQPPPQHQDVAPPQQQQQQFQQQPPQVRQATPPSAAAAPAAAAFAAPAWQEQQRVPTPPASAQNVAVFEQRAVTPPQQRQQPTPPYDSSSVSSPNPAAPAPPVSAATNAPAPVWMTSQLQQPQQQQVPHREPTPPAQQSQPPPVATTANAPAPAWQQPQQAQNASLPWMQSQPTQQPPPREPTPPMPQQQQSNVLPAWQPVRENSTPPVAAPPQPQAPQPPQQKVYAWQQQHASAHITWQEPAPMQQQQPPPPAPAAPQPSWQNQPQSPAWQQNNNNSWQPPPLPAPTQQQHQPPAFVQPLFNAPPVQQPQIAREW